LFQCGTSGNANGLAATSGVVLSEFKIISDIGKSAVKAAIPSIV